MNAQQRAAMQQALEALEIYGEHAKDCPQWPTYTNPENYPKCDCGFEEAIAALREALAQPQGEPVAWVSSGGILTSEKWQAEEWIDYGGIATPLYTTPPSVEAAIEATKENAVRIAVTFGDTGRLVAAAIKGMK